MDMEFQAPLVKLYIYIARMPEIYGRLVRFHVYW
jgi:hypothetical protein